MLANLVASLAGVVAVAMSLVLGGVAGFVCGVFAGRACSRMLGASATDFERANARQGKLDEVNDYRRRCGLKPMRLRPDDALVLAREAKIAKFGERIPLILSMLSMVLVSTHLPAAFVYGYKSTSEIAISALRNAGLDDSVYVGESAHVETPVANLDARRPTDSPAATKTISNPSPPLAASPEPEHDLTKPSPGFWKETLYHVPSLEDDYDTRTECLKYTTDIGPLPPTSAELAGGVRPMSGRWRFLCGALTREITLEFEPDGNITLPTGEAQVFRDGKQVWFKLHGCTTQWGEEKACITTAEDFMGDDGKTVKHYVYWNFYAAIVSRTRMVGAGDRDVDYSHDQKQEFHFVATFLN